MMNKLNLKMPLIEYLNLIASARSGAKQGSPSRKTYSEKSEILGLIGEITWALATNQLPNMRLIHSQGDNGVDSILKSKRVQVKTTKARVDGYLIESQGADFSKVDIYALVMVDWNTNESYVVGWIESSSFRELAEEIDFGYGKRLAVSTKHLNPL